LLPQRLIHLKTGCPTGSYGISISGCWVIAPPTTFPYGTWTNYTVKSGDTLWKIANKYGISVTDLKNNNKLTGGCDRRGR
jgi:hypothetical protein